MHRIVLTAVLLSTVTLTPASAKMMSCTGENMAKSQAAMASSQISQRNQTTGGE